MTNAFLDVNGLSYSIYPIVYLDALHIKLKRDGKTGNVAVYNVLGVDLEVQKEVFGHWIGRAGKEPISGSQ